MPHDYYVYLLVDHDPTGKRDDRVFYVGKGRDARALHHVLDYVRALEAGALREAESHQVDHEVDPVEAQQLVHEKVRRIAEIHAAGREVRIDVLRADLSSAAAYAIESAVIDTLGIANLANVVSGHEHFRVPATAVNKMLHAVDVEITEPALQVTVRGVWGGASVAGLVDATDPEVIWENARQSWSVGPARRGVVTAAALTPQPILLVAISKGPRRLWGGIILGVWELSGVVAGSPRTQALKSGQTRDVAGWEFTRFPDESSRLKALRTKWLSSPRRSTTPGQVGPVGIGL